MESIQSPFVRTPHEIVYYIASFLPPKELVLFGRCCKRIHQISEVDSLWKLFCNAVGASPQSDHEEEKYSSKQLFKNAIVVVGKKIQLLRGLSNQIEAMTTETEYNLIYFDFQKNLCLKREGFIRFHNGIYEEFLSLCDMSSEDTQNKRDMNHNFDFSIPNSLLEMLAYLNVMENDLTVFEGILEDVIIQEIKRVSELHQHPHITFRLQPARISKSSSESRKFKITRSQFSLLNKHNESEMSPENLKRCAEKLVPIDIEKGCLLFIKALGSVLMKHPTQISITLEKSGLDDRSIKYLVDIIQSGKCLSLNLSDNMFTPIGYAILVMANQSNPACKLWLNERL